jgi:hypothetical protein
MARRRRFWRTDLVGWERSYHGGAGKVFHAACPLGVIRLTPICLLWWPPHLCWVLFTPKIKKPLEPFLLGASNAMSTVRSVKPLASEGQRTRHEVAPTHFVGQATSGDMHVEIHPPNRLVRRLVGRARAHFARHRNGRRPGIASRQRRSRPFVHLPLSSGCLAKAGPASRPERTVELQRLLEGRYFALSAQDQSRLQPVLAEDAGLAGVSSAAELRAAKSPSARHSCDHPWSVRGVPNRR